MHKQSGWIASIKVCQNTMRKWSGDARIWSTICLVFLFAWIRIEPLRRACAEEGLSITCWFFPFLLSDIMTFFYFFGVLLLFCDAPFVDNQQRDVILRAGKKNWFRGMILYIIVAACTYFLLVFFVCVIEFVPYVGFSLQWEDMMNILSVDSLYGTIVRRSLIISYSPLEACLIQYMMCVLFAIFLGLLIFYCNLFKKQNVGMGIALVLVLAGGLVNMVDIYVIRVLVYFLPMAWMNIDVFQRKDGGVPLAYAVSMLCVGIAVFVVLIMRKSKSYSIECQEEM